MAAGLDDKNRRRATRLLRFAGEITSAVQRPRHSPAAVTRAIPFRRQASDIVAVSRAAQARPLRGRANRASPPIPRTKGHPSSPGACPRVVNSASSSRFRSAADAGGTVAPAGRSGSVRPHRWAPPGPCSNPPPSTGNAPPPRRRRRARRWWRSPCAPHWFGVP